MLARFQACAHHSCAQCREPERLAHEAAEAGSLSAHAGAYDALCTSASCISLSSVDVPLAFSRPMLNIIGEEQFHCFDAFTGSGSDPPYSDEYSQINLKQNIIWGCPLKSEIGTFSHPLIIQFAAICSALSASRPELKSGTQGYRP